MPQAHSQESLSFQAMGCQMSAWVWARDLILARERLQTVRQFMLGAEARLSRFRSTSELSRLNARGGQWVKVSPMLLGLVESALAAATETHGLYDPTILSALEQAGYDRTFSEIRPSLQDPPEMRDSRSRWNEIELDRRGSRVRLPNQVRLDLGGLAKGWAAERAATMLSDLGPCLVDAGGDLAVRSVPEGADGWLIGIADPLHPDLDICDVVVRDRGVATSGIDYRYWQRGQVRSHHIIDPRTGLPAVTDLITVTVIAPDAQQADLHAKVALILGSEAGGRYLTARPDLSGLLIGVQGEQLPVGGFASYVSQAATPLALVRA